MADATFTDNDIVTQEILAAASQHDIAFLRSLIACHTTTFEDTRPTDVQDPESLFTPLHAAIAACQTQDDLKDGMASSELEANEARATVNLLLEEGAIWNQLDMNDQTPGCIALRLGLTELYQLMVDAGVRAEVLLNRLESGAYLKLEDEEEGGAGPDHEKEARMDGNAAAVSGDGVGRVQDIDGQLLEVVISKQDPTQKILVYPTKVRPCPYVASCKDFEDYMSKLSNGAASVNQPIHTSSLASRRYLSSTLSVSGERLLDAEQNAVMMAWEKDIMYKSADAMLYEPGLKILNIGFGMGIIDSYIQGHENKPSEHHIIEAHTDVLSEMRSRGWYDKIGVTVHEGKWQDVLPKLVADGTTFHAIYFDTFAESYADFRDFFSEQVIGLLDQSGKWSYFNGMGADRQISYDVYQRVVEIDLFEAGFDIEWQEVDVPELKGEWDGVSRSYFNIKKYRLPVCRFLD